MEVCIPNNIERHLKRLSDFHESLRRALVSHIKLLLGMTAFPCKRDEEWVNSHVKLLPRDEEWVNSHV